MSAAHKILAREPLGIAGSHLANCRSAHLRAQVHSAASPERREKIASETTLAGDSETTLFACCPGLRFEFVQWP
jgi:hypothetical protein